MSIADSHPESKLLLFFSVDIVGSTAYKNNSYFHEEWQAEQPWLSFFRNFYEQFPTLLTDKFTGELWKSAGDELIFIAEIKQHADTLNLVTCFKQAINQYQRSIAKKKFPLSLKATAWLVGIPVINACISQFDDLYKSDFIGPSVDTGFRLCKFATSRKFIISVDLAYLLCDYLIDEEQHNLHFFYDGRQILKGVLNSTPYPLIWIDMYDGHPTLEDNLLKINQTSCNYHELLKYCENFINKVPNSVLIKPYIPGEHELAGIPEFHRAVLEKRREKQAYFQTEAETDTTGHKNQQIVAAWQQKLPEFEKKYTDAKKQQQTTQEQKEK